MGAPYNRAWSVKGLSPTRRLTLLAIDWLSDQEKCDQPTMDQIMALSGVSRSTTYQALRELYGLGLIEGDHWRPADEGGSVYVIQQGADGPIKIGRSVNIKTRMRELQTGCAYELLLRHVVDGGAELELKLHKALADHRMMGEWFKPEALALVEGLL